MSYTLRKADTEIKKQTFIHLLLLADESIDKIYEYLPNGDLYYLEDSSGHVVGVIVMTKINQDTMEIKNVAIKKEQQGQGLGKRIISLTLEQYKEQEYHHFIVGTANSSIDNLAFYQKLGFRIYDIKKEFFRTYPEEIWENGIQAIDMIMLEKNE